MKKMKKGFTIVELVIVIGVIAILSAILIPTFVNLTKKANDAKALQEVSDAYTTYVLDAADGKVGEEGASLETLGQAEVYVLHGTDKFTYGTDGWEVNTSSTLAGDLLGDAGLYNSCSVYKITQE